jgi:predicted transposase YdaD
MVPFMPRAAPPQPHDAIFKWVFSQHRHAAGLLRAAMPASWVAQTNFRSLRLEKASFVSRALRSRHSDLLFSVQMQGQKVYFYVLVEHQCEVQALMILRMGIYMMRLWEELLRDHPHLEKVPPIFPLLIHHSATGWTAATAFQDVIAIDDVLRAKLRPYLPHFEMRVVDLHPEQAANLVTEMLTSLGQVALWALSVAGDDARFAREIDRIGSALDDVLRAADANAALEALLRYLAATHRRMRVETLSKLLEKAAGPEAREVIVTFLDEIELRGRKKGRAEGRTEGLQKGRTEGRTEGRAEGRAEGRTEGRVEALLELLVARFGVVPPAVRAKVKTADEATLVRWGVRVLTAASLQDALAGGDETAPARKAATRRAARRG